MSLAGSIVDGDALLEVIWVSFAAGLGVTAVFAIGLVGTTRAVDMRRNGRVPEAVAFGALALVTAVCVAAAVVLAVVVMTHK
jgi:hypothetical protein